MKLPVVWADVVTWTYFLESEIFYGDGKAIKWKQNSLFMGHFLASTIREKHYTWASNLMAEDSFSKEE